MECELGRGGFSTQLWPALCTHKRMVKSLELGKKALRNHSLQTLWRPKRQFLNESWNQHVKQNIHSRSHENRVPTLHSAHLEAMGGAVRQRFADEILQEFGLVCLRGSRRCGRDDGRDSINLMSRLLLLKAALLPQLLGLPTRRPTGISSFSCITEDKKRKFQLPRHMLDGQTRKKLIYWSEHVCFYVHSRECYQVNRNYDVFEGWRNSTWLLICIGVS